MGGCISSCIGTLCGSACSKICCSGKSKENKMGHMIVLFLITVTALILRYWGKPLMVHISSFSFDVCTSERCYGDGAVYILSLALFVFFLVHACILRSRSCLKAGSVCSMWGLKLIFLAGLIVAAFFLPQGFYTGYVHVARVVSGIFLLLQIVLLIDFAYKWNENWMADDKEWTRAIIAVCVVLFAGCLTLFGFMTHWFGGKGCDLNNFLLAMTFLLPMIFTCLSVTAWCEHGALLTSAVVAAYSYWLGFSGLSSDPSATCNALNSGSHETVHLVVGLLIASLTVTYAGYSLSQQDLMGSDKPDEEKALKPNSDSKDVQNVKSADSSDDKAAAASSSSSSSSSDDAAAAREEAEEEESDEASNASAEEVRQTSRFHLFMACSAAYMAMLFTSWGIGESSGSNAVPTSYDINVENVWIKIVTQWCTFALYTWTLVAPYAFPNREF